MTILGCRWFTEMGNLHPIGIVVAEFTNEEQQEYNLNTSKSAYIGTGKLGNSEYQDAEKIAQEGARFPIDVAKLLMGLG